MLRSYSTCSHPVWKDGTNYATLSSPNIARIASTVQCHSQCNAMQCQILSPSISKQLPTTLNHKIIYILFLSWSLYYYLSLLCLYLCQWKNAKGICLSLYKYVVGSISVRNTSIQCIRDMKCKLLLDTIPSLFEIQFQNFNLE